MLHLAGHAYTHQVTLELPTRSPATRARSPVTPMALGFWQSARTAAAPIGPALYMQARPCQFPVYASTPCLVARKTLTRLTVAPLQEEAKLGIALPNERKPEGLYS